MSGAGWRGCQWHNRCQLVLWRVLRCPPTVGTFLKPFSKRNMGYSAKPREHCASNTTPTRTSVKTTHTSGPVLVARRVSRRYPPSSPLAASSDSCCAVVCRVERSEQKRNISKDGFFDAAELAGRFEPPRGGVESHLPVAPPAHARNLRQPQAQRLVRGRGLHSSTFRLDVSTFCGIRRVHIFPPSIYRQRDTGRCDQNGLG